FLRCCRCNSEAKAVDEIFAVGFNNALLIGECHRKEEVAEQGLYLRMKVQLRLFKNECRVRVGEKAHDEYRQNLADTYTHMREIMRAIRIGKPHLQLVPQFTLVPAFD